MLRHVTLALTAVLAAGCGNGHEPSSAVSALSLRVYTAEAEPQRYIMLLDEPALIDIATETMEGCLIEPPCPISVDVRVSSSNPVVVSVERSTVHTPATVPLRGHAAGSATITARVANLSASARVDVVEAPLPLDDLRITLVRNWNDLPTQYDDAGSLTWMSVPAGQTGALVIAPLRNGARVGGVPLTVNSSAPDVALVTTGCRPPSMDPHCDTVSDGWVIGMSSGETQVTVTARNVTKQFTVRVDP